MSRYLVLRVTMALAAVLASAGLVMFLVSRGLSGVAGAPAPWLKRTWAAFTPSDLAAANGVRELDLILFVAGAAILSIVMVSLLLLRPTKTIYWLSLGLGACCLVTGFITVLRTGWGGDATTWVLAEIVRCSWLLVVSIMLIRWTRLGERSAG